MRIIAGFAGVGKSTYCRKNPNALDFEVMPYKYINFQAVAASAAGEEIKARADLILREGWQEDYYKALLESYQRNPDKVYVIPTVAGILKRLERGQIPFLLVYPAKDLKEAYRERYLARGNSQEFLDVFIGHWDAWMYNVRRCGGVHLELSKGDVYLSDILPLDLPGSYGDKTFRKLLAELKSVESYEALQASSERLLEFLPAAKRMVGFDQRNSAHPYDLWEHCLHTVLNLPRNLDDDMLYLAALLHDIGKPDCQVKGTRLDDPNMHYYGHPERSMEIVRDEILPKLSELGVRLSPEEQKKLLYYVQYHDDRVSLRIKHLRRHMGIASLAEFQKLMLLQVADAQAHVLLPVIEERIQICQNWAGEYAFEALENLKNYNRRNGGKLNGRCKLVLGTWPYAGYGRVFCCGAKAADKGYPLSGICADPGI